VTEAADRITLSNGLVSADLALRTGNLLDLRLGDRSVLSEPAYLDWQDGRQRRLDAARLELRVSPAETDGTRAEIAFIQPWSGRENSPAFDVELHYVLLAGERALRMFAVFRHPAAYPAAGFGQSRFVVRLRDDLFDTIAVDADRFRELPPNNTPTETLGPKESMRFTEGPWKDQITDKYHYFTDAGDHFFHGWAGSKSRLGCWIVYGSTEDANGGPTRQHNTAHWGRILLKILTCGHYGAPGVNVPAGESWEKLYGPWMLYLNADAPPATLRDDAARQAASERFAFPSAWLVHPAFPPAAERGSVSGKLILTDPQSPQQTASGAWVGLVAPAPAPDWQQQSLGYQSWTHADSDGRFTLPAVRPGRYTLHAFTAGVLDEFQRADIEVTASGALDLGDLPWTPVRHGRPLWQIGTPDRSAREFRHGDDHRRWGLWLEYPKDFPDDVTFTIGQSDPRRDWNFAQVTRPGPDGKTYIGTTWRVIFDVPDASIDAPAPAGTEAVLRFAFAGAHNAGLRVRLDDHELGQRQRFGNDNAVARAGIHGQYSTWDLRFSAALLTPGRHTLSLEQTAGGAPFKNVMYDCLRLEVPETPK
jgi:rhamnogalacturonan endolyase